MKLEQISLHKTEGAMIRRVRLGGVNRTNVALATFPASRNEITPISIHHKTMSWKSQWLPLTDEILNEEHRCYKRLYTSSRAKPNDPRFVDEFFDSSTLPKLSPHQADSCDGLLTKEECYGSLKRFSKGKSPGSDGLTAEFLTALIMLLKRVKCQYPKRMVLSLLIGGLSRFWTQL